MNTLSRQITVGPRDRRQHHRAARGPSCNARCTFLALTSRVSAVKLIPFKTHLVFDLFAGAVFVTVAALGPFHAPASIFDLVMGTAVIAVVLLTDPRVHATAAA